MDYKITDKQLAELKNTLLLSSEAGFEINNGANGAIDQSLRTIDSIYAQQKLTSQAQDS